VKHYGASSPIWPTRTEKGEAHQLVWPQEVVKKTYHKLGPFSRANFTLSKRREILEKSSVNEILQDSLLRSPLSDKIFGFSLHKVQEEVNKTPQPRKKELRSTQNM
jgi:hypothetical protein